MFHGPSTGYTFLDRVVAGLPRTGCSALRELRQGGRRFWETDAEAARLRQRLRRRRLGRHLLVHGHRHLHAVAGGQAPERRPARTDLRRVPQGVELRRDRPPAALPGVAGRQQARLELRGARTPVERGGLADDHTGAGQGRRLVEHHRRCPWHRVLQPQLRRHLPDPARVAGALLRRRAPRRGGDQPAGHRPRPGARVPRRHRAGRGVGRRRRADQVRRRLLLRARRAPGRPRPRSRPSPSPAAARRPPRCWTRVARCRWWTAASPTPSQTATPSTSTVSRGAGCRPLG